MSAPTAATRQESIVVRIVLAPPRAIERARAWRRFGLLAVYAIIAVVIGAFLWRRAELAGLPDVGEHSGIGAARWPATVSAARNAFPSYQRAAGLYRDMNPSDDKSFENANLSWSRADARIRAWVADNDEPLSLLVDASERPQFVPHVSEGISVQESDASNGQLAARIGWIGTAGLFKAGRLRAEGDHAGAWKVLIAAVRASRHIAWAVPTADGRHHGVMLAQYAREPIAEWSRDKATTVPQLRQALNDLQAALVLTPPLSVFYGHEYLLALESLKRPKPLYTSAPTQPANPARRPFIPNLPALDAFLHGEPERSRRVLNLLAANDLAWCDLPVHERPAVAVPRLLIYERDSRAPKSARALVPRELARWADSALITPTLTWRLGEIEKWDRIDRSSMSQLIEAVAVSLFAKETGRKPVSPAEALERYRPRSGDAPGRDEAVPLP